MSAPLVSTDWLFERLGAPDIKIIDATWYLPGDERDPRAEYGLAHIPGAVFFDIDEICDLNSPLPHMLPPPEKFASRVKKMGLGDGADPLDSSGVHPEAYPLVRRILKHLKSEIRAVIGDASALRGIQPEQFADETFGVPTVTDILKELEKPGRDPRPEFKTASFKDGVEEMKDLSAGMLLEGVVTNVANFGAFVDIGVHQDGLVHVSALADRFVKDPREVVKPGDIVKVKVIEVDLKRKRISLTMRLGDDPGTRAAERGPKADRPLSQGDRQHMTSKPKGGQPKGGGNAKGGSPVPDNAMAAALSKAGLAPRK